MKKPLILFCLLFFLAGALFADVHFKFYPGLYVGGNYPANSGMSIGGDIQLGLEVGGFDYDVFTFGLFGDIGIDTGLPNHPNFYYGGVVDFLFGYEVKAGISFGIGGNRGISTGERQLKSVFFRFGVPLNILGRFKTTVCFDLYPGIGSRLGVLLHAGLGGW